MQAVDPKGVLDRLEGAEGESLWWVAHVRPRCEKKLQDFCHREGLSTTLPLFQSVKKYRRKKVEFLKPLFPGYVFLHTDRLAASKVRQNQYVANLLEPPDQFEFASQLQQILDALSSDSEVRLCPNIVEGQRVRIKLGPLRGIEGVVFQRQGALEIQLRLDFIGQAAALKVDADQVEPV
jgi:transcription antitermination factor NusG